MFLTLHQWHEPEVIVRHAGILTFGRNHDDTIELFDRQTAFLEATYGTGVQVQVIDLPGLVEVSSTSCARRWPTGAGRTTWTRPSTATSCARGCTALTPI